MKSVKREHLDQLIDMLLMADDLLALYQQKKRERGEDCEYDPPSVSERIGLAHVMLGVESDAKQAELESRLQESMQTLKAVMQKQNTVVQSERSRCLAWAEKFDSDVAIKIQKGIRSGARPPQNP